MLREPSGISAERATKTSVIVNPLASAGMDIYGPVRMIQLMISARAMSRIEGERRMSGRLPAAVIQARSPPP
jgi:hypothetical protein